MHVRGRIIITPTSPSQVKKECENLLLYDDATCLISIKEKSPARSFRRDIRSVDWPTRLRLVHLVDHCARKNIRLLDKQEPWWGEVAHSILSIPSELSNSGLLLSSQDGPTACFRYRPKDQFPRTLHWQSLHVSQVPASQPFPFEVIGRGIAYKFGLTWPMRNCSWEFVGEMRGPEMKIKGDQTRRAAKRRHRRCSERQLRGILIQSHRRWHPSSRGRLSLWRKWNRANSRHIHGSWIVDHVTVRKRNNHVSCTLPVRDRPTKE